jgi:hypothetical protein
VIQAALSRDLQDAIDFHHAVLAEGGKALVGYDTAKAVASSPASRAGPTCSRRKWSASR